jgi:hypothetical protein
VPLAVYSLSYIYKTWWGNLRETDHLEDPGVEGWNFRKWTVGGGMDWIYLAPDRDRWWSLENAAINLRVK